MARLKDILEPGERIIAQEPEAFVMSFMRVCALLMVGCIVWFVLDGHAMLALFWAGAAAILVLPDMLEPSRGLYRWQAAITDRRLIYRPESGAGHVAAPLAKIEIIPERDPEEILADPSEEGRKIVKLFGKARIRDGKGRSIGVRHGERYFYFGTGKQKGEALRDLIARAKEGAAP